MNTRLLHTAVIILTICSFSTLQASNLKVDNSIIYYEGNQLFADVSISWENSWRNSRNHDAIWLFAKYVNPAGGYRHAPILADGHSATVHKGPDLSFKVPEDRTGLFVIPSSESRGEVHATIRLRLDLESLGDFNIRSNDFYAYGLEMVYIPDGGFTLGDPDTLSLRFGGVYEWGNNGHKDLGLYKVEREDQVIEVGRENGKLGYYHGRYNYEGDCEGPIPASFPKGVKGFYIMKYELNQGQYVDFLNTLTARMTMYRLMIGIKDYYKYRGTIYAKEGTYFAKSPEQPLNYSSWDDGMAYADWAGLRPMTELEFVKACRGPRQPIAKGFPWGNDTRQSLQRIVTREGKLTMLNGWEESQLNDENLPIFGASYYWVMDLAGSIWERVITFGDEKGRSFTGQHGDGRVDNYGFANVEEWPQGQRETEGFGFRGGGFYTHDRPYGEFNPYSPVAYRRFGGWPGGVRTNSYGQRFVRTDN